LIIVAIAVFEIFLDFPFASIVHTLFKHVSSAAIDLIKFGIVLNCAKIAKADEELMPGI
jgi:hypothetical protein